MQPTSPKNDPTNGIPLSDTLFDVLVIGGGPAGSTSAALLAQRGWRVLLLEKDRHPRFHIGESLLPFNVPLFEHMGLGAEIAQLGLVKNGVDFHSPYFEAPQRFEFANAWEGAPPYAYQVRRSLFDQALFEHARNQGAQVREGHQVVGIEVAHEWVQAQIKTDTQNSYPVRARYLVDASGRDTFMARQLKAKQKNPRHASAALYGHFEGAIRDEGAAEGNIAIYWFEHGWMWFIPLADGTTSVGAVCSPSYLKSRDTDPTSFFLTTLQRCPKLWQRLASAKLTAEVTATGNYSYASKRMTGHRYVLVGDAYAFIDPVFSSGVYLAMSGAHFAADVVDGALRKPNTVNRLNRTFERRVKQGIQMFSWMIYRMQSPVMRDLIMHPRNHWNIERAVISFLAGDVFHNGPVRRRMQLFKIIYYANVLFNVRRVWRSWRARRLNMAPQTIGATDGSDLA